MGILKRSREPSNKENWGIIFNSLVKILRQKEVELQSQVKRCKIFEDKITKTHESWVSDVQNYENKLSMELETMEMIRFVEIAKCNLLLGLKERDSFSCKSKLEHTQDELDDFRAWFDFFTLNKNEICDSGEAEDCKSLEDKIRKLKLDFEKIAFKKGCEVSTLLQESGFAWSQFKRIESGFTGKLMRKDEEIKQANKNISSLISIQEQLQSSNHEKDKIISRLMAKVAEMEDKVSKKDDEISRPSHVVKPSRRSRRLNQC